MTVVQGEAPLKGGDLMEGRCPKNPGPEHDHLHLTFDGKPRCTARSKQAKRRCARAATPGTTVCKNHGSAAPQVRAAAQLRLASLVDPAIATFANVMKDKSASESDKLRAAENVMDRAGFPRRAEVDDGTARALLVARLLAMREGSIEGEAVEVSDD